MGNRDAGPGGAVVGGRLVRLSASSVEFSASMIIRVSTNMSCNKRVSSFALLEYRFEFFFERAW